MTTYSCLHIYVRSAVLHTWYSLWFALAQEKTLKLQGELTENQRASEADRNELVAAKVQRQSAEKERDEQTEKCLQACKQRETFRNEAEEVKKELKTLKVCVRARVRACMHDRYCLCDMWCICKTSDLSLNHLVGRAFYSST